MYKSGELTWADGVDVAELSANRHAPFVRNAGSLLAEMGAIMALLPPPPARVLDAGCASGRLSHFMALAGYDVTGVDVCGSEIEWAGQTPVNWHERRSAARFIRCDFDDLPKHEYDVVIFNNSLHHSLNRKRTLKSAFKALRSGGFLIASEPGFGHGLSSVSLKWAKEKNVTERSCPPLAIVWAGLLAGFRAAQVYPNPVTIASAIYERGGHIRENGFVKLFRRIPAPATVLLLTTLKWLHGITVMRKP